MKIFEVKTSQEKSEFLDFPKTLYKNDPFWVCQLDTEVESVFDPRKNHAFKHGKAIRWILKDENNQIVGRIAAFIDEIRSKAYNQPTGGIGFFEVIENREAASIMFNKAVEWHRLNGMEAIDGPINFGEKDNYWGLLVDGFMQPGFGMPYHKKYYRSYFEEFGFRNYFEQYSYHREIRSSENEVTRFPERIMKIAAWLTKRPGYSFRHFEFSRKEKFVKDTVDIYNSTWSVCIDDFTPLDPDFLEESLGKAKMIIDEELIWFAYFNDKPIAFFILLPDFNQILIKLNGRLGFWNTIRFFYYKATHKMTRMRAVVGGVHPTFQNSGVESAIFFHLYQVFKKKPWYKELELSWVGDFNTRMIAIYEALGAKKAKTHITYRYLINPEQTFIRYKDELIVKQGHNE